MLAGLRLRSNMGLRPRYRIESGNLQDFEVDNRQDGHRSPSPDDFRTAQCPHRYPSGQRGAWSRDRCAGLAESANRTDPKYPRAKHPKTQRPQWPALATSGLARCCVQGNPDSANEQGQSSFQVVGVSRLFRLGRGFAAQRRLLRHTLQGLLASVRISLNGNHLAAMHQAVNQ